MTVRLDATEWLWPLLLALLGAGGGMAWRSASLITLAALAALVALERGSRWATSRMEVDGSGITIATGRVHPRRDRVAAAVLRAIALEPQSLLDVVRGRGTLVLHHEAGRGRFGPVRDARRVRQTLEKRLLG